MLSLKPVSILLIPVFLGCDTVEDIGIRYELDSNVSVKFEEIVLPATNIYINSLRTDVENAVLIGNYSNDITGSVSSEAYVSMFYQSGSLPGNMIASNYEYDSIRIVFQSGDYKGKNSGLQKFEFYELKERLGSGFIYLRTNRQEKLREIGSDSILLAGSDTVSYNFQLDDTFGMSLFNQLSEMSTINSTDLPSLALTSSTSPLMRLSTTSDSVAVLLYVTEPDAIEEITGSDTILRDTTYVARFRFTGGPYYSYIERDKTGSLTEGIENTSSLDLADGTTIIDPLSGVVTSVDVTPLREFFSKDSTILISTGTFIYELEGSDEGDTLSRFINYFRMPNGEINSAGIITDPFGNIIMTDFSYLNPLNNQNVSTSTLNSDKSSILLTGTLFLQSLYRDFVRTDSLLLTNPSPLKNNQIPISELVSISTNSISLSDARIKKDGVKLRLYFTQVD